MGASSPLYTPAMRTMPHPRSAALLCAAALVLVLGACGQKGALYHPADAPAPATVATPAPADAAAEDARKKDEKKPDGAPR
jgi:predicted small lipoprotein YifL